MVIDHLCRVRHCVNPDHMRVCTRKENLLAEGSLSPANINKRKTVCNSGHEYTPENTYYYPNGTRGCVICMTAHNRARYRGKEAQG